MKLSILPFFSGSASSDFKKDIDYHPFQPCPQTPNCVIHSVEFSLNDQELFQITSRALRELSPHKIEANSQSLQIEAVFRIRLFGFKDDVNIIVESSSPGKSILQIKSASRIGQSDIGVNRRRVKRILRLINRQL